MRVANVEVFLRDNRNLETKIGASQRYPNPEVPRQSTPEAVGDWRLQLFTRHPLSKKVLGLSEKTSDPMLFLRVLSRTVETGSMTSLRVWPAASQLSPY